MEKLAPYFSFRGRANRKRYWFTILAGYAVLLVALLVTTPIPAVAPIVVGVAFVGFIWVALATAVRRLHDRNKSAWWLVPMYGPLLLLSGLAGLASASNPDAGAGLSLLSLPFSIWVFVELGCLKGTAGANRFGADPLQPLTEVFS